MDNKTNVITRKKHRLNVKRSLSLESVDSLDSVSSVRSMMDLSTHIQNDELISLKNTIKELKEQIQAAHAEIETLNLDNNSLKNTLNEEKLKNEQLKKMYITSMSLKRRDASSLKMSRKKRTVEKSNLTARRLDLDLEFGTPKASRDTTLNNLHYRKMLIADERDYCEENAAPLVSDKIHNNNNHRTNNDNFGNEPSMNNKLNTEALNENKHKISQPEKKTNSHTQEKENIILLCDNQGEGLIQQLLGSRNRFNFKDYGILALRKNDALTTDVLGNCDSLSKTVTKNDHVVIMTGCNDTNPIKVMADLSNALKQLEKCNVYVVNVLYNASINVNKLNDNLKLITKLYDNCVFIETNLVNLVNRIVHNINSTQYKNTFLNFQWVKKVVTLKRRPTTSDPKKGTIPYYFKKPFDKQQIAQVCLYASPIKPKRGLITSYFPIIKQGANIQCNNAESQQTFFRALS